MARSPNGPARKLSEGRVNKRSGLWRRFGRPRRGSWDQDWDELEKEKDGETVRRLRRINGNLSAADRSGVLFRWAFNPTVGAQGI